MDQSKIEEIVQRVLSEELGKRSTIADDSDDISPLLKELRDTVKDKIAGCAEDNTGSSLLEDIKNDVEKSIS